MVFRRKNEKPQPASDAYSVLDAQIVVRGDIETEGTLRIDGRLEGNVLRAGSLVVGATGTIVGDVRAAELVICGTIQGNIDVERRVELESTANVIGDLSADAILVHEGGTVRGRLQVRSQATEPATQAAPSGLRIPPTPAADAS
jgi:cytoskeletal protein CcmA (bactofilin family)